MQVGDIRFISYPAAVQWREKGAQGGARGKKALNHLLWGDWSQVRAIDGNWVQIRARGRTGWVRTEDLQETRILEINFVDIGQGDGCHIQTPDDRALVIDAGEADNMYRFLRWRFGRFAQPFDFECFIVTHPDKDHYHGFTRLFDEPNVRVGTVFHNSIVEQVDGGERSLGAEKKIGRTRFLTGLVHTLGDMKALTDNAAKRGNRLYPNMMKKAVDSGRVRNIASALASPDWASAIFLPGFAPADDRGMTIKLLGPVPQLVAGLPALPRIGNDAITKNGHSVVLLLEISAIKMLLGGDLNEPSQNYLLEHYTGLSAHPTSADAERAVIEVGRKVFQVDLAKACHHGSAHVAPLFLQATNPLATVVSSGDDEPHSHPRPDTLGLIGRFSRGSRPTIFSTELARSGTEHIKHPNQVRRELRANIVKEQKIIDDPTSTPAAKQRAEARLEKHLSVIQRSVANYGMINVLTDGQKMVVAQRLERERAKSKRWDIYRFEPDSRGRLAFVP